MTYSLLVRCGLISALSLGLLACQRSPEPQAAASAVQTNNPAPPEEGVPLIAHSADGVHIQYRSYGAGEVAVVLIHGWSGDSNYWQAQLPVLRSRYRVVAVDLAGHGGSGRNRQEWSMARFGEDIAAVVQLLPEEQRVILVGHAMGAPVALAAAPFIKNRLKGIIAVDSLKMLGQAALTNEQIAVQLEPFRRDFIGQTRRLLEQGFFTPQSDPKFIRKIADDMSLAPPEIALASLEAVLRVDYRTLAAPVAAAVPVVAINADHDQAMNLIQARKLLPTLATVIVKDTSHFLMLETPERFNPVLLAQLAQLSASKLPGGS
jgi:pimeloyl-ACP methyl ester carboxylesterase